MPEAPLLHKVPSLTGCFGSPSMLMTRPSRVDTTCPQPTPQNGQTVVVSVAPFVLSVGLAGAHPVSDNAPIAAAPVVTPLRNWRRVGCSGPPSAGAPCFSSSFMLPPNAMKRMDSIFLCLSCAPDFYWTLV